MDKVIYDEEYFAIIDERETSQANTLAGILQNLFNPGSVLDLGCATGLYLKPFLGNNIRVKGVDNSKIAKDMSSISEVIDLADLSQPYITEKADLTLCIEVIEHIEKQFEWQVLDNICDSADLIVFTGATIGQPGTDHVNCQPKEYWIQCFVERGFVVDEDATNTISRKLRQEGCIYWLVDNILIFRRMRKVHFILTSCDGQIGYPYYLAILSALKTQRASEIMLHSFVVPIGKFWELLKDRITLRLVENRNLSAFKDKDDYFRGANYKDLIEYQILHEHGGLVIDLDTFCVRDAMGLLDDSCEVVASSDYPLDKVDYPINGAILLSKRGSPIMLSAVMETERIFHQENMTWGDAGPKLLSLIIKANIEKVKVLEQGILGLCGHKKWGIASIFEDGTQLPEQTLILHLFAGSHKEQFAAIDEAYITTSNSLYANTVRNILTETEWNPTKVESVEVQPMRVHFVNTGKKFPYIYYLGIMSAYQVYGDRVCLWLAEEPDSPYYDKIKGIIEIKKLKPTPNFPALDSMDEHFRCVAIFDWFIWDIVYKEGGMIMGLDSLTLASHFDLLEPDKELLAPIDHSEVMHFSMHGAIVRKGSKIAKAVITDADSSLYGNNIKWGDTGIIPYICHTKLNIECVTLAPFGVVGGRHMELFKENGKLLADDVRTIALYGSSMKQEMPVNEAYIENSQSPYARLVRELLPTSMWKPSLVTQGVSSNIGHKEVSGPPGFIPTYKSSGLIPRHKRFHLLGLPHIATNKKEALACAFSQKVIKMAQMLKSLGHTVYFYGVEGSTVECDEFIQVSTQDVLRQAYGDYDTKKETYRHGTDNIATKTFNENCIVEIRKRMESNDFLLIPFSPAVYKQLIDTIYNKFVNVGEGIHLIVEMGIGYRGTYCPFRVWESVSQMHFQYGLDSAHNGGATKDGGNYDVVIPNYFDPNDFTYSEEKEDYFLYLGRVVRRKGVVIAVQTTREIGARLIVAGQKAGENVDLSSSHVEDFGFANLEDRRKLLSKAKGVFLPTSYIEPFGGVCIEAALSGTPTITSDWGAFPELVLHGKTGYRCRTFDHYVWAAQNIGTIKPIDCYEHAMTNFTLERVALMYEEYFDMLLDVKENVDNKGWNRLHPERTSLDWLVRSR